MQNQKNMQLPKAPALGKKVLQSTNVDKIGTIRKVISPEHQTSLTP